MNSIANIKKNSDDFEKFKAGIEKFFSRVDENTQNHKDIDDYFNFLHKYNYKASCGFGKGNLSNKPYIVFIRRDSNYDTASKGVYCRINIERGTDSVEIIINESKTNKIKYKAQQDCEQYNRNKQCNFKRDNLDSIVEQVLKDMEWFANLSVDSIKDTANDNLKTNDDSIQNKGNAMKDKNYTPPLNQILYGPPGTGKTYNTINRALEILGVEIQGKSRAELKAEFDKFRTNGQIAFVTFHQSFSYEEFVEGIKPKLVVSSEGAESSEMSYEIKSGIFKQICDRALHKEYKPKNETLGLQVSDKTKVWKISIVAKNEDKKLRETILKHCFDNNEIRIGWSDNKTPEQISMLGRNNQSSIYQFENEADIGDMVCVFDSAKGDVSGIGIIESEFFWDKEPKNKEMELYPRARKVKWLSKEQINIFDLNGGVKLTLKTFYLLDRVNAIALLNKINKLGEYELVEDNTKKPFILIIDEINRGNISKILGELITLIEPSKRIGASEELRITLPYSNDSFGVPSNLYIIGTMNTADRSIALLDTALRRRFEFVEMMPDYEELQKIWLVNEIGKKDSSIESWEGIKGDDGLYRSQILFKILTAINNRIEFLLDREHTIGHAFFFEKAKFYKNNELEWYELTLESLKEIFAKKIIPLLQEYFYDDYAKISAVLNHNGIIKAFSQSDLGVKLSDDFVDSEKRVYRISDAHLWDIETFTKIYQSNDSRESSDNE
ncbi:AAA family ATPase [Helicobacter sp. 23-1044]